MRWRTASLAGDFKVTNDELADVLLSIARDRKNQQNCVRDNLVTACCCPDWANPSMHTAATYFLLAEELDRDPFIIFELRGRAREQIVESLRGKRTAVPDGDGEPRACAAVDQGGCGHLSFGNPCSPQGPHDA